jgi:tRNA G10  N-methylase Trm11
MRTFIQMANIQTTMLPDQFGKDQDVRYPDEFVRYFVEHFSKRGDVVVDPFAGFGTTVRVAEEMGRQAYGVEFDKARCDYVRTLVGHPERIFNADSRDFESVAIPDIDLSLTSPPYMGRTHTENPFTAYSTVGGGYGAYLHDLKSIYSQIKLRTRRGGHAVIEVSNLKHDDGTVTTLAWDIALAVSEVWKFAGEVIITWQPTYAYGYDHSYALIFTND